MLLYSVIFLTGRRRPGYLKTGKPGKSVPRPQMTLIRKEWLSPKKYFLSGDIKAFLLAPLFRCPNMRRKRWIGIQRWAGKRGSLTVEAALVLPLFLFCMIAVLQFGVVMEASVKFGAALAETGRTVAAAAYLSEYGGASEDGTELAVGMLSAAYVKRKVLAKAGKPSAVKNANMLLSSFFKEEEMIDLVLTYQIRSPVIGIPIPGNFFLQRASIRAWTGRTPKGGNKKEDGNENKEGDCVYVTATGGVYHEDPECTYLKLSIRSVDKQQLATLRNRSGGKYHTCERCGGGTGGNVYITKDGNRYHSSLSCSGLKRTVKQVKQDECGLRACSKCGKH